MSNAKNESSTYTIEGADREYGWSVRVVLHLPKAGSEKDARAWAQAHGIVVRDARRLPIASRSTSRRHGTQRSSSGVPFSVLLFFLLLSPGVAFLLAFPVVESSGPFGIRELGVAFAPQIVVGGDFLVPLSQTAQHGSPFGGSIRLDVLFLGSFAWACFCGVVTAITALFRRI